MPVFSWLKIAAIVGFMFLGGLIAHQFDKGEINHQRGLVTAEKLAREKDVKEALIWSTQKQKVYDDEAIHAARQDADAQRQLAADANERVRALASIPPRVLVRGCLSYEFVRQLDAAITHRAASALPLPAGKPNDACAPVDAVTVVRWLLGVVETAQANGQQLDDLRAFFRAAQAAR